MQGHIARKALHTGCRIFTPRASTLDFPREEEACAEESLNGRRNGTMARKTRTVQATSFCPWTSVNWSRKGSTGFYLWVVLHVCWGFADPRP